MRSRDRTHLDATAYHEAGHAIARWWLGLRFKEASIVPNSAEGTLGYVLGKGLPKWFNPDTHDDNPRVRLRAEKEIISLFAGRIAEQKFRGRRPNRNTHYSDTHSAVDLATYFHGGETLEAFLKYLFLRSRGLVDVRWHEIGWVAEELLQQHRLTYKAMVDVIKRRFSEAHPLPTARVLE
jgi:hypothetical protein